MAKGKKNRRSTRSVNCNVEGCPLQGQHKVGRHELKDHAADFADAYYDGVLHADSVKAGNNRPASTAT
jgi:hypothetical protein